MKKKIFHRTWFGIFTALLVVGAVALYEFETMDEPDDSFKDSEFTCMLDLKDISQGDLLLSGYNYLLVNRFAESLDARVNIRCNYGSESSIDSLKQGAVDMIVIPYNDSISIDSVLVSRPIDSTTVWIVRDDRKGSLIEMDEWIGMEEEEEDHITERSLFIHRFSPQKAAMNGRHFKHISPYDDVIKKYASNIGWDWRMLAAVVFQESRFHIEAHSPRGAQGLMQMMPATARKYGVDNLLDPEESIRAGAEFLQRLQKLFSQHAADSDELHKFTLAAYNAGEGRMMDCINYAKISGGDSSTWDGIVAAIPGMRDETILELDTIKLGMFQGHETIAYIDNVMELYDAFCTICPK